MTKNGRNVSDTQKEELKGMNHNILIDNTNLTKYQKKLITEKLD